MKVFVDRVFPELELPPKKQTYPTRLQVEEYQQALSAWTNKRIEVKQHSLWSLKEALNGWMGETERYRNATVWERLRYLWRGRL